MKHNYFLFCVFYFIGISIAIGQSNKYLQLDGVDDFMEVLNHDDLNIGSNENFTVTAWVKSTKKGEHFRLLDKRDGSANGPGYEIFLNPTSGAFAINVATETTNHGSPEYSSTSITDGQWHHVAFVVNRSDGTNEVYANGEFQHQRSGVPATASFANAANFFLGKEGTNDQWYFNGAVDELRIWSKAMTAEELTSDMTTVVEGSETALIAAWNFEEVTDTSVPDITGNNHTGTLNGGATIVNPEESMAVTEVILNPQTTLPVGRGNLNERVVLVNVKTSGQSNPLTASALDLNLAGTAVSDINDVKVYYTGNNPGLSTTNLFGAASPSTGTINITGSQSLGLGDNYFWVTYDISNNANEGEFIDAAVESVTINDEIETLATTNIPGSRLILLAHNTLWSGGDYGSVNYRIPAITTALDGTLIVAADARVDRAGDLPNNVDIVVKRSTDNGQSWSEPTTIADFGSFGASDPALVLDRFTGDIICVFASHNGLFASTPNNKIRMQVTRSKDNGLTWSEPEDISNQVYPDGWYAAWVASGSMHQTRSGRIIAVAGTRKDESGTLTNNMIYSNDGGYNWDIETNSPMPNGGDETKIIELNDGTYLMNHRDQYKSGNYRRISTSSDEGVTWSASVQETQLIDPGVNADLIRYTSTKDGFDQNRILFSNPKHPDSRKNLHVYLSTDETETWPTANSKQIFEGSSGYSSLTILEDGTIGLIYENGEFENYQITFARLSLDWLSSGTDTYSEADAPQAASNLNAIPVETNVELSWEDNSTTESGFRIYRSNSSGSDYTLLENVGSDITSYVDQTVEPENTYYYVIRAFNPGGNAAESNEATATALEGENCDLTSMTASDAVFIEYVKFANTTPAFDFSSGNIGYQDHTSEEIEMTPGGTYTLHIGAGNSEVVEAKRLDIWIDYNQDGDFDDEGELFLGWGSNSYTGTDLKFSDKMIPSTALPGTTRMRVALKATNSPSSPCDTFTDGEVEDYTIVIATETDESMVNCPEDSTDDTPPVPDVANLPDITTQCAVNTLSEPTATDNCSASINVSHDASLPIISPGTTVITWTYEDLSGNKSTQTQNVIITDTEAPELVSQMEATTTVFCHQIPTVPELEFTDNCDDEIEVAYSEIESAQEEGYKIIRTWTATDSGNNKTVVTQEINVLPIEITNPTANSEGTTIICITLNSVDLFDLLEGELGNGNWEASQTGILINGSTINPSQTPLGKHILTYTEQTGMCDNQITIEIEIVNDCLENANENPRITITDVLTPNGDGINDSFIIEGPDVQGKNISLMVFNRWGQIVYRSNNYQNDWDASNISSSFGYKGKAGAGTYYYIIEIPNSTIKPIKGNIYIGTN